ncbi:hypothetical protein CALCODRAFT_47148 [Calocera cornea HHB12733]|uniref:Uncharacterized protein n=1 Tax=Calocera cornea HHB12733 TaxID=1353952 RepID=A0A165J0M0_9BASI|nr:hypothetical protein CALCODRAFT_47148 [Calocera cornea HHB12733]
MSAENKTARVYSGFTNRKTPKATPRRPAPAGPDRRVVFKSVLHNPLQIEWPVIPLAIQPKVLAAACEVLKDLAPYYLDRRRGSGTKQRRRRKAAAKTKEASTTSADGAVDKASKKRKRGEAVEPDPEDDSASPSKKPRTTEILESTAVPADAAPAAPADASDADVDMPMTATARQPTPAPPLLDHLTIGINEVTRQLEVATLALQERLFPPPAPASSATAPADLLLTQPEAEADAPSAPAAIPASHADPNAGPTPNANPPKPPRVILVCRPDISPPLLVAHLPLLVAAYNSLLPLSELDGAGVHLVTLPKGGELALAASVGLRRVAVLAFDADAPSLPQILKPLHPANLRPLTAPWLSANPGNAAYIPTHVKQLRTSAPRDMGRAKRERVEGRRGAKAARVEKAGKEGGEGKADKEGKMGAAGKAANPGNTAKRQQGKGTGSGKQT